MIEPPPWKREPEQAGNRRGARKRAALWGGRGATGIRAWPGERLAEQAVVIWRRCRSLASQVQLAFNRWLGAKEASSPINRYALHLVVILMAFGVVTVSRIKLPEINVLLPAPTPALESESQASTPLSSRGSYRPIRNTTLLFQAPVPHTTIPEREQTGVITYTVRPNDTLWSISQAFELRVETIAWANPEVEQDPDLLSVGQVLNVLPVDGIYYTVKSGDTVEKLAKTYKTTADKIIGLEFNQLSPPSYTLTIGQKLIVVDGTKPVPKPRAIYYPLQVVGTPPKGAPVGSGRFMWPVVGYWMRGFSSYHYGIDIANAIGTPVYAADDGYVMLAGQDTWGYGLQVIIDHGNGYKTRYAHLSKILVKAGQAVKRGEKIGLVGSTGRSTGPHLHFEIIKGGVRVDPTGYLPR